MNCQLKPWDISQRLNKTYHNWAVVSRSSNFIIARPLFSIAQNAIYFSDNQYLIHSHKLLSQMIYFGKLRLLNDLTACKAIPQGISGKKGCKAILSFALYESFRDLWLFV